MICIDEEGGRRLTMRKTELVDYIAKTADISKSQAAKALEGVILGICDALKKDETVSIIGFGTFSVTKRAARTGLNPRTKAPVEIKAGRTPRFKAGKRLKDAVN